jgi:hypothetical protein
VTYLAETKRASHPSSVHSGHIVNRVLVAGEVKISVLPSVPSVALEAGPWVSALLSTHLKVGRGSLSAAAKSWAFHWSQASSQLLNTLNAIFTRFPWGT